MLCLDMDLIANQCITYKAFEDGTNTNLSERDIRFRKVLCSFLEECLAAYPSTDETRDEIKGFLEEQRDILGQAMRRKRARKS